MNPKSLLHYEVKKEVNTPLEDYKANLHDFNLFFPPFLNSTKKNNRQFKRYANGSEEPTGFLVEKKQILVQYKPSDTLKKVPKCSHYPKESKSHEKQMKHPFYKNTQRLDELLDRFLDNSIPDLMTDPFGVDVLFKNNKNKLKMHKTNLKIEPEKPTTEKADVKAINKAKEKIHDKDENAKSDKIEEKNPTPEEKPLYDVDDRIHFRSHKPKVKQSFDVVTNHRKLVGKSRHSTTSSAFDVLLSVSTIVLVN